MSLVLVLVPVLGGTWEHLCPRFHVVISDASGWWDGTKTVRSARRPQVLASKYWD